MTIGSTTAIAPPLTITPVFDNRTIVLSEHTNKCLWTPPTMMSFILHHFLLVLCFTPFTSPSCLNPFSLPTPIPQAYFADYGPSYVEWLGELSWNVPFEDKYTSVRTIEAMSHPIPHPKEIFELETVVDTTTVIETGTITTSSNDEETLIFPADANAPTNNANGKQLWADEETPLSARHSIKFCVL